MDHYPLIPKSLGLHFVVACLITAVLFPSFIRWLRRHEVGQYLREDGPASHAAKAKTPTMGGVCFIAATILTSLVSLAFRPIFAHAFGIILILALALACGWLGFSDDYAKLKGKANAGLSARFRLCVECILGAIFGFVVAYQPHAPGLIVPHQLAQSLGLSGMPVGNPLLYQAAGNLTEVRIPHILIVPLSIFLVAATTNAFNLHDGMDGLAAGTGMMVLLTLSVMIFWTQLSGLPYIGLIIAGSLLGFLFFNRHPAQVFMGDTGSLFVGGSIAGLVIASGLVLFFIPLSAIYIAESLSVMAQVAYFKLTKPYQPPTPMSAPALFWHKLTKRLPGDGKRLFLMAPLHHHFEALLIGRAMDKDRAEWLVVGGFWLVQLLLCAITLTAFFAF